MKCHYHPDRESIANCIICGKPVCAECGLKIGGNTYCKDCVKDLIASSLTEKLSNSEPTQAKPATEVEPVEQKDISQGTPVQADLKPITPQKTLKPEPIKEEIPQEQKTLDPQEEPQLVKPQRDNVEQKTLTPQEPQINRETQIQQTPANISPNKTNNVPNQNISLEAPQYDDEHFDSEIAEQLQKSNDDDFIIPVHSEALENKYEKYLDDLYYDEPGKSELSLSEQLARDEAQHGPLTKKEYVPQNKEEPTIVKKEAMNSNSNALNNIHYNKKPKKEGYSAVDIILTIILIALIILVIFYIVYLFLLSAKYPTFIDAIFGLSNPSVFFSNLIQ